MRGLWCLHRLNIVHRDLKPQNILLDFNKKIKISDMGLAKKLEQNHSSYLVSRAGLISGTLGWRAAEIILLQQELSSSSEEVSIESFSHRLSKKVDIFSAGCLLFYILTRGEHPFGNPVDRERNILDGRHDLSRLEDFPEAHDLICLMLKTDPSLRPTAEEVLNHPFFWDDHKKLSFLKDASDRLEIEKPTAVIVTDLEADSAFILGNNEWTSRLDSFLLDNLGKYRKYDGTSVRALVRVIRNKSHHYYDLPPDVQNALGSLPCGFLNYFLRKFLRLFMGMYRIIRLHCRSDPAFAQYFHSREFL
eukprot:TRINITY_DN2657_c0_g1_i2.p1 TRINITY_DN2657_c0_g1~~TRINITY_DN2657_c0_g1_i2.p1  ORF type:complete len:305 (+),score=46.82 TRINITY_DN2657_c0_g1_i2:361-1275(+)